MDGVLQATPLGDLLSLLRVLGAILLIFILPGYGWTKALWPAPDDLSEEYNALYVAAFSMVFSIATVIFAGFAILSIPVAKGAQGLFTLQVLLPTLLGLSAIALLLAWWRGGLAWAGRISPRLVRMPRSTKRLRPGMEDAQLEALVSSLRSLSRQREELRAQVRQLQRRAESEGGSSGERARLLVRADRTRKRLGEVESQIAALESSRSDQLAHGSG